MDLDDAPSINPQTGLPMPGKGRRVTASIRSTRAVRQVNKKQAGEERKRPQARAHHSKVIEKMEVETPSLTEKEIIHGW